MPNQTRIFLPLQNSEVKLCADKHHGLDDATLWPQPWVKCSVIWAPFSESLTIPMMIFQSCGGTQPLMTSNFSALQPFHLLIIAKCFILNIHRHQLEEHLVHFLLHSCMVYFLTHYFENPKPQTTQTGDFNKSSSLDSPYTPYPIPAWSAALQTVDKSPSRLVEASKSMQSYGHHIFSNSGLFIHLFTAAKYIESWL
jgi:hypothetical protein